jgi:methylmalonyl-CoA mutase
MEVDVATGAETTDGTAPAGADDPTLAGVFPPATEEQWLALVDKVLKGKPFSTLVSRTADGITVAPLYTRDAAPGAADEAGFPGRAPFTRGAHAAPRPHGLWDVRSTVDATADPAEANRRALVDLERGVTSLEVAWAPGADLGGALDGVHLDLAPVVLRAGFDTAAAAAALRSLWDERGIDPRSVAGGLGADTLASLAALGGAGRDPAGLLAELGDLAASADADSPRVRAVTVSTVPAVEAGASEAQELAVMLSSGAAYLRALAGAGLDADRACGQIEVTLGADADVFATLAKLRAARRLWSALATACGAGPEAAAPVLHVRTARRMLTRRDPWVNLLRITAAVFAAGVGGADGITADPYDVLVGDPGDLGRRMARNTQLLLLEESNLGRVLDPAGGSGYVESLTDELSGTAWTLFQQLEEAGGMPTVLLDGSLAARITDVRTARLAAVATRRSPITGVSEFPNLGEPAPPPPPAPVSGTPLLEPVRWAERFESLRDAADAARAAGDAPEVFLANLGPVAVHTARSSFARNLFEAGGIEAVTSERGAATGFAGADEVAEDFRASGARIACLCSSDGVYAEQAPAVARALKDAGAGRVYLAGNPGDRRADEEAGGVDEFVHVGVDVLDALAGAHRALGIEEGTR